MQNFDGGKFRCFWCFPARPSKFNPSNHSKAIQSLQVYGERWTSYQNIFYQIFVESVYINISHHQNFALYGIVIESTLQPFYSECHWCPLKYTIGSINCYMDAVIVKNCYTSGIGKTVVLGACCLSKSSSDPHFAVSSFQWSNSVCPLSKSINFPTPFFMSLAPQTCYY